VIGIGAESLWFFLQLFSLLYRRASPRVLANVGDNIAIFYFFRMCISRSHLAAKHTRGIHHEYEISVRLRPCLYMCAVCTVVDHFLLSASETLIDYK